MSLSGCGIMRQAPTITALISKPTAAFRPISDQDALIYADSVLAIYQGRSLNAQLTDIGGSITVSGLSGAAVGAASGGASPSTIAAIVAAGSFLAQVMGIVDPVNRANALAEGSAAIRGGESAFLGCIATGAIVSTELTACGSALFAHVNGAINVTERIMVGLLPRVRDLQAIGVQ